MEKTSEKRKECLFSRNQWYRCLDRYNRLWPIVECDDELQEMKNVCGKKFWWERHVGHRFYQCRSKFPFAGWEQPPHIHYEPELLYSERLLLSKLGNQFLHTYLALKKDAEERGDTRDLKQIERFNRFFTYFKRSKLGLREDEDHEMSELWMNPEERFNFKEDVSDYLMQCPITQHGISDEKKPSSMPDMR